VTAFRAAGFPEEYAMSLQQINVLMPPAQRLAPGTAWIADVIGGFAAAAAARFAAWRRHLVLAAEERQRVRGRMELQAMATRYMATQPSFAKELLYACMNERDA
jgi:hypothetical protein